MSATRSYHIGLFLLCFISNAMGGAVSTLMSVYLPVAVKDLLGTTEQGYIDTISAYINALFIVGWAMGGFIWGMIGDTGGRKLALLLSIACYGLFTVATGMADSWGMVLLCRFMSGFGVGGVLVTSVTLLTEVWPDKSKAIFIGILSIAFPVGIFSAGLINYFVDSWREGFLIGLIPLAMSISGIFFLQESAHWKSTGTRLSGNSVRLVFTAAYRRDLLLGSLTFGTMLIGLWAIFSWLPTWVQSISGSADAQKERGLSMMLLGMAGLTGGFFSGWLAKAIGMRKSMILCFSVCVVLSFVLFKTNKVFSPVIYPQIAGLALFFGASQGVLSSYIPQLFPSTIRATATGFCFNIGRLFTAAAVLSVGILVHTLGGYGNAIFIFSLVFIPGLLVILFIKHKKTN
jgi:MFS family permease